MSDQDSPYRGPPRHRPDKRERERGRTAESHPPARERHGSRSPRHDDRPPPRPRPAPVLAVDDPDFVEGKRKELRLYGMNACRAMFAQRPEALRKVWLVESRIPAVQPMLAWCVKHRLGYRVVEAEDLHKLSGSEHHEGIVCDVLPSEPLGLSAWLRDLPAGPALALWLDGVGNPHNLGAILRNAAHFGASAVLLPKHSTLALSGAAARVAEGGAERVPFVRLGREDNSIAQLRSAGFDLAATVVRGGHSLYSKPLPDRLVLVIGAEQVGVSPDIAKAVPHKLGIPGSGAVESLNVASATAVFLGEWRRQHPIA